MTEELKPEAAPVEPVAVRVLNALWPVLGGNHLDADTWHEISKAVSDATLTAHPPAAPTDALVEKAREWAIAVREADKQWSQPLSTLLEQLATALAAMQEAGE